jgi:heptaprenyl diphosphate synthase
LIGLTNLSSLTPSIHHGCPGSSPGGIVAYRLSEVNVVEILGLPALEEQLRLLEPMLKESVVTGDAFLDDVTTHLIAAGGKRLRPVLALAAATSGTRTASRDDLLGAVSVELVHLASLYHDDVMDEATIRRNVESVNSRFGNLVAIVAGDFLLARSAGIAAGLGTEIAGLLAGTLGELCQGQVAEVRAAFQVGRTEDEYIEAISGKTASLMATSCRIGALTAGLPRPQVEAFTAFGRCFGMIFQVRDDILDVVGSDGDLGKPAGQDLAEGIYTLPVLLALADPDAGPELRPLLGQPLGQPEQDKARSIVSASNAVAESVAVGRRYAVEAEAAAARCSSPDLAAGFARLAHSLLDGLPSG